MSGGSPLPNIAEILGPLLQRVPVDQQPLLIAVAERLAADRYRSWAGRAATLERKSGFLACADREEEIARRVEALYPAASAVQREMLERNPDLVEINRALFAPYALEQQYLLQAQGERVGAATWRAFAQQDTRVEARDVFLSCALLEEQNATFLESICVQ